MHKSKRYDIQGQESGIKFSRQEAHKERLKCNLIKKIANNIKSHNLKNIEVEIIQYTTSSVIL